MTNLASGPVAFRRQQWLSARTLVPTAVFAYLLFARTRHITDTFDLLGDQILYWKMAMGPWRELPLAGPTSVGGTTLGPSFIWSLWVIRHLVGPWTDLLPHAGGIGISFMQSAADTLMLVALWRKTASLSLALAVTILIATSPMDLALSATIWNPPVATAFVKTTIALILLESASQSIWWGLAATVAAVLAVQAHSSAVFVAAPAIGSFILRDLVAQRWMQALARTRATLEVVLVLELPYILHLIINRPSRVGPSMVIEGVAASVGGSADLRLRDSFEAVTSSTGHILLAPASVPLFGALLVTCLAITAYRLRHQIPMLSATVAPPILAIVGFATWQHPFDTYWFLTLAPSAALTIAFAATAWRPASAVVAAVAIAGVLLAQPSRLRESMTSHRLPEYGALLRGTREVRRRTPEIRAIEVAFALPPTASRDYMYTILGGRVTPAAKFIAVIGPGGNVVFRPASE